MIRGTEHFSFTVSNMNAALDFFCGALGLKATPVMDVDSIEVQTIVGMPGASLRISLVQIPGNANIELIEYVKPAGKQIDSNPCNPGVAHIAFLVDDMQKAFADLSGKGIRFVNPPVWLPGNDGKGRWGVAYLKGPDDITIEFVEKQR
jgi:catechol 2,3-dioxygenase-like lactoylglutathione lyase family enzyme